MDESKLLDIIAKYANYDANKITMEMNFADDLGVDSLDLADMISEIEDKFNIEVDDEDLMSGLETVGSAIEMLKNKDLDND